MIDFELARKLLANYIQLRVGTEELVLESVQGSTIRAYEETSTHEPLSLFREWSSVYLKTEFEDFNSCKDYEVFHQKMVRSLSSFWFESEQIALPDYRVYKLVDLLGKKLPHWIELSENQRFFYLNHVHVPVDKFSLGFLRQKSVIYEDRLKGNESMGWLKKTGMDEYPAIQAEIRKICGEMPPIVFDLLSWNSNRDFKRKLKKKK